MAGGLLLALPTPPTILWEGRASELFLRIDCHDKAWAWSGLLSSSVRFTLLCVYILCQTAHVCQRWLRSEGDVNDSREEWGQLSTRKTTTKRPYWHHVFHHCSKPGRWKEAVLGK